MPAVMKLFKTLTLLLFLQSAQNSFAQTGCVSGNAIYNLTGYTILGNPYYATYAYSTNAHNCPRAELVSIVRSSCNLSTSGFLGPQGTLYNYRVLNSPLGCDIDNCISVFILMGAVSVTYFIKRKID